MNIRRRKNRFIDAIESGSLSDLAFLLIIYFIVIAGFNIPQGYLLSLPTKDAAKLVFVDDVLRFSIRADGSLIQKTPGVNGTVATAGQALDQAAAQAIISDVIKIKPNITIALGIAPDAPWQSVVNFLEHAQTLHVENFSFGPEQ